MGERIRVWVHLGGVASESRDPNALAFAWFVRGRGPFEGDAGDQLGWPTACPRRAFRATRGLLYTKLHVVQVPVRDDLLRVYLVLGV